MLSPKIKYHKHMQKTRDDPIIMNTILKHVNLFLGGSGRHFYVLIRNFLFTLETGLSS